MLRRLILFTLLIWISYLLFWFLAITTLLIGILFIKTDRKKSFVYAFILSPLVVVPLFSTLIAIAGYYDGTAKLRYVGLPSLEFFNLDPKYRINKATSGCLVDGGEFLENEPNNATLKWMINTFGYMKGSYQGIYPTKEEAHKLLQKAQTIQLNQFISRYSLDKKILDEIQYAINPNQESDVDIKLHQLSPDAIMIHHKHTSLLIDIKHQKIFAKYRFRLHTN